MWHETQPREETTYIVWMSTEKITVSPRIKGAFVSKHLKLKIVLYRGNIKPGPKARFLI